MEPPRWKIITPSQYEWERRALGFIRCGLPNHDPYRAWANFEFQTPDGAIYEVDLLVLTKQGFWLVEIKSWRGRVGGVTWVLGPAANSAQLCCSGISIPTQCVSTITWRRIATN